MSRIAQIEAVLDALGDAASAEDVELGLRGFDKRDIMAVLAARSGEGGAALTVTDGVTTVEDVSTLDLTGHTVSEVSPGVAEANVSVPVQFTSVVLTDAQFKALPSTPVEILPAPAAGQHIVFVRGFLRLDRTAGAYTNNGAPSRFWLGQASSGFEITNYAGYDRLSPNGRLVDLVPAFLETDEGFLPDGISEVAGEGIVIACENSLGNFTGGNAANTFTVTLLYMVVDL